MGGAVADRGKRRSRPLPIKAIDEDVVECGWPIMTRRSGQYLPAFNIRLIDCGRYSAFC